jgi:hypothetical protein
MDKCAAHSDVGITQQCVLLAPAAKHHQYM